MPVTTRLDDAELDVLVEWLRGQLLWTRSTADDAALDWIAGPDGDEMADEVSSVLVGAHLVLHEPRAELALVEAQLALLDELVPHLRAHSDVGRIARRTVQYLAWGLRYREGYRDEWRP